MNPPIPSLDFDPSLISSQDQGLLSQTPIIKLYQCELCHTMPDTDLKTHQVTEHARDLFHCTVQESSSVCGDTFISVNALMKHLTLEHNIYTFTLDKLVKTKKIVVPEDLRLFRCQACHHCSFNKQHWINHVSLCSKSRISYECRACPQYPLRTEDNLKNHINKRHSYHLHHEQQDFVMSSLSSVSDNLVSGQETMSQCLDNNKYLNP